MGSLLRSAHIMKPQSPRSASSFHIPGLVLSEYQMGIFGMALLIFQGTSLSLTLRYSRTQDGPQFLASVAVIWTESIKLLLCVAIQFWACRSAARDRGNQWVDEFITQTSEIITNSLPMALPAVLFVMQQILVIIAASHLDAVTFQICSQAFKILPTAVFAAVLLGTRFSPLQWASLPVLAAGITLITATGNTPSGAKSEQSNLTKGLTASALSGLSSAFAGVYFEKFVKGINSRPLTVRNLQLSLFGVPLSVAYALLKDGASPGSLTRGFTLVVWSVVALQVMGGLVVAMVVKYADNILKNFANAISVVFVVLLAVPMFGQYPSGFFLVGVATVCLSIQMYGANAVQSAALSKRVAAVLQSVRDSASEYADVPIIRWARGVVGPAMSYGAALMLALAGAATILLVVAAKTQSIPMYLPGAGLQLMSAGELEELAALSNRTARGLIQL